MGWLKRLFGGSGGSASAPDALWLYAQCGRCGQVVAVRVNRRNDPVPDYDTGGYILTKEIMDDKCFRLMRAEVHYDSKYKVVEQTLEGGKFLTREEYEAAAASRG